MLLPLENLVKQCDFILGGERDELKIFSQLNYYIQIRISRSIADYSNVK